VLGVSTAINALAWGVRSTFALFYVALLNEFAWDRGSTALGYSLSWLGFVIFAPVAGWLSDRWGPRTIVTAGGLLLGLALGLTAQTTSLALYYVWFGFLGAAGMACMIIPSTTIVTRWFVQSRGTAMGILSTGGPASGVVFYPVNAWLIATFGWRTALIAFGAIIAGVAVSLTLLYRERPAEAQRPIDTGEMNRPRAVESTTQDWSLGLALRNHRLWAAFTMTALGVIGFQIMATHQVAHAVDHGFQHETVVWLFSFGAACMMAGNLLGGWLSDHFGRDWVFAFGTLVAMVGIGCLAFLQGPQDVLLLLIYIASGFGFGMRIAQLSAIPADVFAGRQLGAILGVVQAGGGLGGAIGPFLGGWLFDVTGSYRLAFAAACAAIAGSALAAWFAARRPPDAASSPRRLPLPDVKPGDRAVAAHQSPTRAAHDTGRE